MVKTIKIFGDSFTHGSGMPDYDINDPWNGKSKMVWPYFTFKDHEIQNFAWPSSSNDAIGMKLVRYAQANDCVAVAFSFPERIYIAKNGCNLSLTPQGLAPLPDNGAENYVALQIAKKHDEQYKRFLIQNYDDSFFEIMYLKNILFCQNFCESNNINYFFTLATFREKVRSVGSLKEYRDSLYSSINWDNVFLVDGRYGFCDYASKIEANVGLDGVHYDHEYHKLFGNLFLDWIDNKNKL